MCGIVGYIGAKNAQEFVIDGLEKLEYRGYDSAGIAVNTGNEKFEIVKYTNRYYWNWSYKMGNTW